MRAERRAEKERKERKETKKERKRKEEIKNPKGRSSHSSGHRNNKKAEIKENQEIDFSSFECVSQYLNPVPTNNDVSATQAAPFSWT